MLKVEIYKFEKELVSEFLLLLNNPRQERWQLLSTITEFNYTRGRTDVIAVNQEKQIIAFEMKLKKWRDALHQAYRNTCFAHFSYIVVPEKVAKYAIKYANDFYRRSVGICYISDSTIHIPIAAEYCTPIQEWLTHRAVKSALEMDKLLHAQ